MVGRLYVVLAIDTEGPVTDKKNPELLNSWKKIDRAMTKLFDESYRNKYPDNFGGWLKVSWFILYWTGFKTNPVKRDFGYHKIYDHYLKKFGHEMKKYNDGVYWHYHHPPLDGVGNKWGTDWTTNLEYFNILNRMVIDRKYFPPVFRAGGTIENNDTSYWLEQWIPFDYSNRAGDIDWNKLKGICDWSRAPAEWWFYRPNLEDYQTAGGMNRMIFRCLDLRSSVHVVRKSEIEEAFRRAGEGKDTIMSFFEHDYRDIANHVENLFLKNLADVSKDYPDIKWKYSNAREAAREILGCTDRKPPVFDITLLTNDELIIRSNKKLFGLQPYFVIMLRGQNIYKHYPLDIIGKNVWYHRLQFPQKKQIIGVAANDPCGNVGISLYSFYKGDLKVIWKGGF
jgi:hypothetical protein